MELTIILLLAIALIISIILCLGLYQKMDNQKVVITNLQKNIENITKQKRKLQETLNNTNEDLTGRTGVYVVQRMFFEEDRSKHFNTTYEIEILESTNSQIKIKGKSFTVNQSWAKDQKYHKGILDFIENRWVDRSEVQLIMDDATKRNIKLEKLGIK